MTMFRVHTRSHRVPLDTSLLKRLLDPTASKNPSRQYDLVFKGPESNRIDPFARPFDYSTCLETSKCLPRF